MTDISKRLEQTLRAAIQQNPILPVKVDGGILVGDVKITNQGSIKDLWQHNNLVYAHIYLNSTAIAVANLLARRAGSIKADKIYKADQEYGKWFNDSQMLRARYQQSKDSQDHDRADILWARYYESRDRAIKAKNHAQSLAAF